MLVKFIEKILFIFIQKLYILNESLTHEKISVSSVSINNIKIKNYNNKIYRNTVSNSEQHPFHLLPPSK